MGLIPFIQVTRRREPVAGRDYSGGFFRGVVPMTFQPQASPPPVPYGDFYANGRDPYHVGRTHDVTVDLPIQERQAVMGWPFFDLDRDRTPGHVIVAAGGMNPIVERVNIEARGSMAFGDLTALDTTKMVLHTPPDLLKLVA